MDKNLLSGFDLTARDVAVLFKNTAALKKDKIQPVMQDKVVALLFQKPSMRTRVSFEVGARQLGASCMYLAPQDIQLGVREPVKDVARVLSRFVDMIITRTFAHEHVVEIAQFATVPVINGLSDEYHPCQALADIFTIQERTASFKGQKLAYIGDGNNVVHSLMAIAVLVGLDMTIATPKGYEPHPQIIKQVLERAQKNNVSITLMHDPKKAMRGATAVYTDVWTSMGQEQQRQRRLRDFRDYQVNAGLLKHAAEGCLIMHCMPMHRGEEITDKVAESKHSVIIDQAENRLHVQKAVMAQLIAAGA